MSAILFSSTKIIFQKDLAKLYISLGAISSAYQIYEKLEMWEDAVLCLIRTDRTSEAIKIIEKQLKSRETANLWCLLGDILQVGGGLMVPLVSDKEAQISRLAVYNILPIKIFKRQFFKLSHGIAKTLCSASIHCKLRTAGFFRHYCAVWELKWLM